MPPYQRAAAVSGLSTRRGAALLDKRARTGSSDRRQSVSRSDEPGASETHSRTVQLSGLVVWFLIGLVIPWVIYIGSLRLSVYRIVLVATIIPCFIRLARREVGRIRLPDIAIILYSLWGTICLVVAHGLAAGMQSAGILFVETTGAYLLGRCYIRSAEDFEKMVALLFKIVVVLLPFALVETATGQKPVTMLFGIFLPTIEINPMEPRWGLTRVQGPYEHPILFGVCCGSILALTHMVLGYRQALVRRWSKSVIVAGTAFLALSSGPLTALVGQCLLLCWNRILIGIEARWKILWGIVILINIAIYLYSGESIARFFISHAPLFDAWSAYYRLLIWNYGTETVLNHPIFGIGYHEYERPSWMPPSVDMFWLNHAIMFGFPGALLIGLTFVSSAALIGMKSGPDNRVDEFRTGYLLSMAGFFMVGWTVHFWNGTYSFFIFLLASGLWLAEVPDKPNSRKETGPATRRRTAMPNSLGDGEASSRTIRRVSQQGGHCR
ncbi:hypothetical protein GOA91_31915 [Sinorhizobium meliloti]|nr:hypothetical protein [Sinorhizobium meliloti]MDX0278483.1 hypothetical protein [Sinorhizobium meliloti]